jgi:hypothetical protein
MGRPRGCSPILEMYCSPTCTQYLTRRHGTIGEGKEMGHSNYREFDVFAGTYVL